MSSLILYLSLLFKIMKKNRNFYFIFIYEPYLLSKTVHRLLIDVF